MEEKLEQYLVERNASLAVIDALEEDKRKVANKIANATSEIAEIKYMQMQTNYMAQIIRGIVFFYEGFLNGSLPEEIFSSNFPKDEDTWNRRVKPRLNEWYKDLTTTYLDDSVLSAMSLNDARNAFIFTGSYGVNPQILGYLNSILRGIGLWLYGSDTMVPANKHDKFSVGYTHIRITTSLNINGTLGDEIGYFDSYYLDKEKSDLRLREAEAKLEMNNSIQAAYIVKIDELIAILKEKILDSDNEMWTSYFVQALTEFKVALESGQDIGSNPSLKFAIPQKYRIDGLPYRPYFINAYIRSGCSGILKEKYGIVSSDSQITEYLSEDGSCGGINLSISREQVKQHINRPMKQENPS